MIEPAALHKHFKVRDMNTGREVIVLGGDVRYSLAGTELWHYRQDAAGEYFLVALGYDAHWGYLLRPSEAEAIPGGQYHPDWDDYRALQLSMTYEGSWREHAARSVAP